MIFNFLFTFSGLFLFQSSRCSFSTVYENLNITNSIGKLLFVYIVIIFKYSVKFSEVMGNNYEDFPSKCKLHYGVCGYWHEKPMEL